MNRFFVWAANSVVELTKAEHLHSVLKNMLPKARVYLLILVDCQNTGGPVHFADTSDDLLFYRFNEKKVNKSRSEVYAAAVAFAVRFWAAEVEDHDDLVVEVATIQDASWIFQAFNGGDPANEPFLQPVMDKGIRSRLLKGKGAKSVTKEEDARPSSNSNHGEGEEAEDSDDDRRNGCASGLTSVPRKIGGRIAGLTSSKRKEWERLPDNTDARAPLV